MVRMSYRPSVPPLLWFSLSIWIGCALGIELVIQEYVGFQPVLVGSVACLLLTSFGAWRGYTWGMLTMIISGGLVLGFLLSLAG